MEGLKFKGSVAVLCGPGNNGGDGFVCARHLKLLGYSPVIWYPKPSKNDLMSRLVHQVKAMDMEVKEEQHLLDLSGKDFVVDALFGFSFKPPARPPFLEALNTLADSQVPILSVDIPSGWDVESGPPSGTSALSPKVLVSLTAPKLCAMFFAGTHHFLGGRFVPNSLAQKYALNLPPYPGIETVVDLGRVKSEL